MQLYTGFGFTSLHDALSIADIQQPLGSECAGGSLTEDDGWVLPICKLKPGDRRGNMWFGKLQLF